jgi:hypothetical protein
MRKLRLVAGAIVVLLGSFLVGVIPAHASLGRCQEYSSVYSGGTYEFCVQALENGTGSIRGHAWSGTYGTVTVYVEQCRGDFSACGTIAANQAINNRDLYTSWKPEAGGHVYRGCGSFVGSGVTVGPICAPWIAVPT